jgi:23S rRNA (uridine2552-2'-O)-methyltransferase
VIDFGAAPGAWTQVASKLVGNKGKIIAVDKNPIRPFANENVVILLMDIRSPKLIEFVQDELSGKVDVIISDLAGNTSGNWHLDVERQVHLATIAFESATELLLPGGNFITKVFRGPPLKDLEALLKKNFKKVKNWRPPATRKSSAEEYIICMNYTPVADDIE